MLWGLGSGLKGRRTVHQIVPIQIGKLLAPQKQDVEGDVRLPVWACTDMTLDWKLNSHLQPCSSRVSACTLIFILYTESIGDHILSLYLLATEKIKTVMRGDNRKQEKKKIECISY